jgi:hypothetical protein
VPVPVPVPENVPTPHRSTQPALRAFSLGGHSEKGALLVEPAPGQRGSATGAKQPRLPVL